MSRVRPTYAVNYRHQRAIRIVIRHPSIAWVPAPMPEVVAPLRVQYQVLLTTLSLLLNCEARQLMPVRRLRQTGHIAFIDHRTGIRLAQLQKIRAGPARGRLTLKDRNFSANDFWPPMDVAVMRCD